MANDRLRDAMARARVTVAELATYTENDTKTVSRWLGGRVPHPRTRFKVAKRLREDEEYLWPGSSVQPADQDADPSGLVQVFGNRGMVPPHLWDRLLDQAASDIGILVYVGMFLTEKPDLQERLRKKARNGARIRLIFGDRDSEAVVRRSDDEGIGRNTISAKIDHALAFFAPLAQEPGIEIRTHGTVLYNSIYIFDRDMIVNPHVYGLTAPHAPAFHVRKTAQHSMFETYESSFTRVWHGASLVGTEGSPA